jgi:hypothetical protein
MPSPGTPISTRTRLKGSPTIGTNPDHCTGVASRRLKVLDFVFQRPSCETHFFHITAAKFATC